MICFQGKNILQWGYQIIRESAGPLNKSDTAPGDVICDVAVIRYG